MTNRQLVTETVFGSSFSRVSTTETILVDGSVVLLAPAGAGSEAVPGSCGWTLFFRFFSLKDGGDWLEGSSSASTPLVTVVVSVLLVLLFGHL